MSLASPLSIVQGISIADLMAQVARRAQSTGQAATGQDGADAVNTQTQTLQVTQTAGADEEFDTTIDPTAGSPISSSKIFAQPIQAAPKRVQPTLAVFQPLNSFGLLGFQQGAWDPSQSLSQKPQQDEPSAPTELSIPEVPPLTPAPSLVGFSIPVVTIPQTSLPIFLAPAPSLEDGTGISTHSVPGSDSSRPITLAPPPSLAPPATLDMNIAGLDIRPPDPPEGSEDASQAESTGETSTQEDEDTDGTGETSAPSSTAHSLFSKAKLAEPTKIELSIPGVKIKPRPGESGGDASNSGNQSASTVDNTTTVSNVTVTA